MSVLTVINAALAFALELVMLGAAAWSGYQLAGPHWWRWVLAVGLPILIAAMWGIWAAPNSSTRLHGAQLITLQSALLMGTAGLWWLAGGKQSAVIFAILVVISQIIAAMTRQA